MTQRMGNPIRCVGSVMRAVRSYLAYSTLRLSRITMTLIWPG